MKDLNPGETVNFTFAWPKEAPPPEGGLTLAFDDDPFVKVVAGPRKIEAGAAFRRVRQCHRLAEYFRGNWFRRIHDFMLSSFHSV